LWFVQVSLIGGVPAMLGDIADESVVITFTAYLCTSLSNIRYERRRSTEAYLEWAHQRTPHVRTDC